MGEIAGFRPEELVFFFFLPMRSYLVLRRLVLVYMYCSLAVMRRRWKFLLGRDVLDDAFAHRSGVWVGP